MSTGFVSDDRRLAVVIEHGPLDRLVRHCRRAGRRETGGILIGRYSPLHDQAIVTEVTGPPPDSIAERRSFLRGIAGLQRRIDRAWRRHDFYLGEWHFHPFASPEPSARDRKQIQAFAADPSYACPEPILIVVGGDPSGAYHLEVRVVVQSAILRLRRFDKPDREGAHPSAKDRGAA